MLDTTNTLKRGARVTVYGRPGTVRTVTTHHGQRWIGVHLDGEYTLDGTERVDQWAPSQVTP